MFLVIQAVFHNSDIQIQQILAKKFWPKANNQQPCMYVVHVGFCRMQK